MAGGKSKIKEHDVVLTERVKLVDFFLDVPVLTAYHPKRKFEPHFYPDIRLISDWPPDFIQSDTWKEGDEEIQQC